MKLRNIKFTALAASAALLLSGAAAHADLNYDQNTGNDVVAAFSTGGNFPHSGNTYYVNFGNLSLFQGAWADGKIHTISNSGSSILTDLNAAGISTGAGTWSLFGADINGDVPMVSRPELTNGVQSAPYIKTSTASSAAGDMLTAIFSYTSNGTTTTANSDRGSATDPSAYGSYVYGANSPTLAWETYSANPEGTLPQELDLYSVPAGSGPATLVGGFRFDPSSGLATFDSNVAFTAVPEPSTFAFAAGLVGFCAFRRVRRSAVLA